jgi:hypothetical protein
LHIINREHWQPQAKTIDEEIGGRKKLEQKKSQSH